MMGLWSPPDPPTQAAGAVSMTERESERSPAKLFRPIVSLRRVWKTYMKGGEELLPSGSLSSLSSDGESMSGCIPSISLTPPDSGQDVESEDGMDAGSGGSPTSQDIPELENHHLSASSHLGVDSETESVVSDYSEMADPVKEHLANVQIVRRSDSGRSSPTQFVVRERVLLGAGEGEEEFVRRLRKTNFLSLAQEFADLKRQNEDALPFNLHESRYREQQESETDNGCPLRGSVDISLLRNDPEGGRDPGWQDETPMEPGLCVDNVNAFGTESRLHYKCQTLVEANDLLVFKPSEVVDFYEGGCRRNRRIYSEDTVLTSERTGKLMQLFSTECAPDVVHDPPSIVTHDRSDSVDLSLFCISDPKTVCDQGDCSDAVDGLRKVEDFDDCTIERVFPQWDWKGMEEELVRAKELQHEKGLQSGSRGERDEILQRLAMLDEEEWYVGTSDPSRTANPLSMGVCYVNEAADDLDPDSWGSSNSPRPDVVPFDHDSEEADDTNKHSSVDDLLARQATLEVEARMALAQVRPMARLHSGSDSQMQEKLVMEMMNGSASSEEKISRHIGRSTLERMTVTQLQIFANDLSAQIEVLNLELMLSLVDRDDLHMVQDSMLVDIEDLTGRAREYAAKVDTRRHEKLQVQKCV